MKTGASVFSCIASAAFFSFFSGTEAADLPICEHTPRKPKVVYKCPKPKPETCIQRAAHLTPVQNTIESTAIIQLGIRKECFLPEKLPTKINQGEKLTVNVRLVYNDGLFIPLNGRGLRFSVVDSFGFALPQRSLNIERAKTQTDGFPDQIIVFTADDPGVYRVRVDYVDRDLPNFALSPNIIVIGRFD